MRSILFLLIFLFSISSYCQLTAAQYKVKSLEANSEYGDFGTTFYGTDKIVFSSSRKVGLSSKKWDGNDQPFLDLYIGDVEQDGEITKVRPFSSTLNSKYHDAMVAFSPDLRYVYFTSNVDRQRKKGGGIKIFRASVGSGGQWKDVVTLPFNSDKYDTNDDYGSDNRQQRAK